MPVRRLGQRSIIRKLGPPKIRRDLKEYFRLHRSENVRKRLDERAIKYMIRQLQKGARASDVALQLGVTSGHVRRLWEHFLEGGSIDCIMPRPAGRPASQPAQDMIDAVVRLHEHEIMGVQRTARRLHEIGINISHYDAYRIMTMEGMMETSEARSGRRKWPRYERRYSNAMWHVDWHTMKDPRLKGVNLIVYLDDASRCVTGFGLFSEATSENAVLTLRHAIGRFGTPGQILSDHGSQFTSSRPTPKSRLTAYQQELQARGIAQVLARIKHPQTNGKLERFFGTLEGEIGHFEGVPEFIEYYNEDRLHFSLDIDSGRRPRWHSGTKWPQKRSGKTTQNGWRGMPMNEWTIRTIQIWARFIKLIIILYFLAILV